MLTMQTGQNYMMKLRTRKKFVEKLKNYTEVMQNVRSTLDYSTLKKQTKN